MTTETIEQVAVTPEAEQSQVTPETQVEQSEAAPAAESGPDEELVDFLKQSGFYEGEQQETSADDGGAPEASDARPLPPEVQSEVEKALTAERQAADTAKRAADYQARIESVKKAYNETLDRLESILDDAGASTDLKKTLKDQFRFFNGHISEVKDYDHKVEMAQLANSYASQVQSLIKQALPADAWKALEPELPKFTGPDGNQRFFKAVVEKARIGYLSPAQAKKLADERVLAFANDLKAKGILPSAKGLNTPSGGNAGGGGIPSLSTWNSWTLEQRHQARQKDPEIEFKIMQRGG